jgi:hypothetical protein
MVDTDKNVRDVFLGDVLRIGGGRLADINCREL